MVVQGIRRRSAASASRARVNSFSLTSIRACASDHSAGETTLGLSNSKFVVVIINLPFARSTERFRVGTRAVNGRQRNVQNSQVRRKLSAVMVDVVQHDGSPKGCTGQCPKDLFAVNDLPFFQSSFV